MTGTRILLAEDQAQVLQFLRLFPEHRYDVVGAVQDERMLLTAVSFPLLLLPRSRSLNGI